MIGARQPRTTTALGLAALGVCLAGCAAPTEAELFERIRSPDRGTRLIALQDMAVANNPTYFDTFRDALVDPEPEFRRAAIIGLRSMHSARAMESGNAPGAAVPELVRALDDKDPEVRRLAAEGLGALGGDAVGPMLETLRVQLAPQDAEVPWSPSQRTLLARIARLGPAALPGTVEVLGRGTAVEPGPRLGALAVLERLGPTAATAVREIGSSLRRTRSTGELCAAARALGALGAEAAPAVPTLVERLTAEREGAHRDEREIQLARREALMAALGATGQAAAAAVPLLEAFADPGYPDAERIAAASALGSIPGPQSLMALRRALARSQQGTRGVAVLAGTLRGIGGHGPEAAPALDEVRPHCLHVDRDVRTAAIGAIGAMGRYAGPAGARSVAEALPLDDAPTREAVVGAFEQFGPRLALPLLAEALEPEPRAQDPLPPDTWAGALEALAAIGEDAAPVLDDVLDFVRRGTDAQQAAAVPALGAMGKSAVPPLVHMLGHPEERSNAAARPAVQNALVRIGRPAADALAALLGHERSEVAQAARTTLADIGAEAVPALVATVRHGPTLDAQRDAIQTLREIGPAAKDAEEVLAWAQETRELVPYAEAALRAVRR